MTNTYKPKNRMVNYAASTLLGLGVAFGSGCSKESPPVELPVRAEVRAQIKANYDGKLDEA